MIDCLDKLFDKCCAEREALRRLVGELVDALECYWKNRTAPIGGHPQPSQLIARARKVVGE